MKCLPRCTLKNCFGKESGLKSIPHSVCFLLDLVEDFASSRVTFNNCSISGTGWDGEFFDFRRKKFHNRQQQLLAKLVNQEALDFCVIKCSSFEEAKYTKVVITKMFHDKVLSVTSKSI